MNAAAIRTLQSALARAGLYAGQIDGLRGPRTDAALRAALEAEAVAPDGWRSWPAERQAVALLQVLSRAAGIDPGPVDGIWGPRTEAAVVRLARHEPPEPPEPPPIPAAARPDSAARPAPAARPTSVTRPASVTPAASPVPGGEVAPPSPRPAAAWPRQDPVALTAFYGPNGLPGGRTPPLVRVPCPWPLRLAWDRGVALDAIAIHARCAESLARVLARVHQAYGTEGALRLGLDLFGGSYNPRRMRGGSRWSVHAWGAAIDWDPARNRLTWGRDRARLAGPDYARWWQIWEEEGWTSLGRARDFDWMHVQAAGL